MATKKIVSEAAPRVVYTCPCGRVTVERHASREYLALLDGQPLGYHTFSFQAEEAGHVALAEALAREAEDVPCIEVKAGGLTLTIDPCDLGAPVALCNGTTMIEVSPADLRALVAQLPAEVSPAVRVEPSINDETNFHESGKQIGNDFIVGGEGKGGVTAYVPLRPGMANFPVVLAFGQEMTLEQAEAFVRAFTAIKSDPRFIAARAAYDKAA